MRVLLVSLYCFDSINARFMSGFLKKHGHRVDLLHFKDACYGKMVHPAEREIELAAGLARELNPDLIGLSVRSSFFNIARKISDALRKAVDAPQLWGGLHPTLCPEDCMGHGDMILRGEGEGAMLEIANRLDRGLSPAGISGLWVRQNGGYEKSPGVYAHQDLDKVSIPDLDYKSHFVIDGGRVASGEAIARQRVYYTMRTRGCPFHCSFCNTPTLRRMQPELPSFRTRSLESLMTELQSARDRLPELKRIFFYDDVFTARQSDGFLETFADRYAKEIGLPFGFWQHPSLLDEQTLRLLAPAGLNLVGIGLQSGSEKIRQEVFSRNTPASMIRKAQGLLHEHKIEHAVEMIGDLPYETEETCRETLALLLSLKRPFRLSLFSLSYLPKTELTARLLGEGKITTDQVEGKNEKALAFRISFRQSRPAELQYFYALFFLTSKSFVPKMWIRAASRLGWLKRHPFPVILAAKGANVLSGLVWGARLFAQGEMDKQRFLRGWRSRRANLR